LLEFCALTCCNSNADDADDNSNVANSARQAGAVANLTANNKATKYDQLTRTRMFCSVAIEMAGSWHREVIELVEKIGKRIDDQKETAYLFQQLSVALQRETRFLFKVPSLPASPLQSYIFFFCLTSACLLGCLSGRP